MNREEALKKQYGKLRALYFAYLAMAICALVFYFINKPLTLALLGVSLVYHLLLVRPRSKEYERAYNQICIEQTLARYLKDATHAAKPPLDAEEISQARLVPANTTGGIHCWAGGMGNYHGRTVRVSDATLTHSFFVGDKKRHEFVTGAWISVALEKDTGFDWRLLGAGVVKEPSLAAMLRRENDLQRPLELPPWISDGGWTVLRPEGFPDLPHSTVLKQIRSLADSTKHPLAVHIQKKQLNVFLVSRILGQKVNVREAPEAKLLAADRLPELSGILKLSDVLINSLE
jgi:hypothetical protein